MQHFKLAITPIPVKRLELIQTLESLLELCRIYCEEIKLTESKRQIIITGMVNDKGQLKQIAGSKEFEILNGALTLLSVKTEFQLKAIRDSIPCSDSQKVNNT